LEPRILPFAKTTMADSSIEQAEERYGVACSAYHRAETKKEKAEIALARATRELAAASRAKEDALEGLRKLSRRDPCTTEAAATARSDAVAVAAAAAASADDSGPSARTTGRYEIGQIVEKHFPGYGTFRGEITGLPTADFDNYEVKYVDGDAEHLPSTEIHKYVVFAEGAVNTAAEKKKRSARAAKVTPSPPKKKRSKRTTKSSARPRKLSYDEDGPEWLSDMLDFLENVPHGPSGKTCSSTNAKSVFRQVRKLCSGDGITYKGWEDGVIFAKDRKITLEDTDLDALHKEARAFEAEHGRDKGHGWLLLHPIKKMKLYKEHRDSKPSADLMSSWSGSA